MSVSLSLRGVVAVALASLLTACGSTSTEETHHTSPKMPPVVHADPMPDPTPVDTGMDTGMDVVQVPVSAQKGSNSVRMLGDGRISRSRAYPTGDPATSAVMVEKIAPAEVMVGQPYPYEIRVTNLAGYRLEQVLVNDVMTDTFNMLDSKPAPVSQQGGLVSFAIGDLDAGQTKSIMVEGTALAAGSVTYCSEVSYVDRLCLETLVVEPKIRVIKSGPELVMLCDAIRYVIEVTNDGSGTARNVVVTDELPDGLVASDGSNRITIQAGDLAAGQTGRYEATVKATRTGSFQNVAQATADGGLNAVSGPVNTDVVQPVLDIVMSCPGYRLGLGTFDYELSVTNNGDGMCEGTMVNATIPSGASFVSATDGGQSSGGQVSWSLGSVAPGESASMSFSVRATNLGEKSSRATVTCACAEPAMADCSVDVQGIPAVLLEVVDSPDPVAVGETTTYTISVTNQGSLQDTNIRIVCELESQAAFVGVGGITTGSHEDGTITFEPLTSLAPGDTKIWTVQVRANGVANTRFRTIMTTDQLTRTVEETESTNFYQ